MVRSWREVLVQNDRKPAGVTDRQEPLVVMDFRLIARFDMNALANAAKCNE